MELSDIQAIISKVFEQVKTEQVVPLINWLDGEISKYRISGLGTLVDKRKKKKSNLGGKKHIRTRISNLLPKFRNSF
jgi:hypothetical protein